MKDFAKKYMTLKFATGLALALIALAKALGFKAEWLPLLEAILKVLGAFA